MFKFLVYFSLKPYLGKYFPLRSLETVKKYRASFVLTLTLKGKFKGSQDETKLFMADLGNTHLPHRPALYAVHTQPQRDLGFGTLVIFHGNMDSNGGTTKCKNDKAFSYWTLKV